MEPAVLVTLATGTSVQLERSVDVCTTNSVPYAESLMFPPLVQLMVLVPSRVGFAVKPAAAFMNYSTLLETPSKSWLSPIAPPPVLPARVRLLPKIGVLDPIVQSDEPAPKVTALFMVNAEPKPSAGWFPVAMVTAALPSALALSSVTVLTPPMLTMLASPALFPVMERLEFPEIETAPLDARLALMVTATFLLFTAGLSPLSKVRVKPPPAMVYALEKVIPEDVKSPPRVTLPAVPLKTARSLFELTQAVFAVQMFQVVLDVSQVPPPVIVAASPHTVSQLRVAAASLGSTVAKQAITANR